MVCHVVSDLASGRRLLTTATSDVTVLSIAQLPPMPELLKAAAATDSQVNFELRAPSSDQQSRFLAAHCAYELPDHSVLLSGFGWAGEQWESVQSFIAMIEVTPLPFKRSWIQFGPAVRSPNYGEMAAAAAR
jgi:hypothetical protein